MLAFKRLCAVGRCIWQMESNARIVRWSDGSLHLFLGSDALAADCFSMKRDNAHLFLHHTAVRLERPYLWIALCPSKGGC